MPPFDLQQKPFWQTLAPELTVDRPGPPPVPLAWQAEIRDAASASLHDRGYLQIGPVFDPSDLQPLRAGIAALGAADLPPVFIFIYDQPWRLFQRLAPLVGHFLGERFSLLPNFWAWHVPARPGAAGWPRHRDCQGQTRFVDGDGNQTLMSLSLWLALTDATLDNGCMYVLPRGRPSSAETGQGLALPAPAGSVLGWTQDLEHWSGRVNEAATWPRMSLSLEFQNTAFAPMAKPQLDVAQPPPFADRLALIGAQFPKYRHMEDPAAGAVSDPA